MATLKEYSDIDFSFKKHPITKSLQRVTGIESIKSSLNNILRTNNYDRLYQPEIGSRLRDYLFEPMNSVTENRIRNSISDTIRALEPRAEQYQVNVESLPDVQEYRVQIKFYVRDQLEPVEFETTLTRVR